MNVARFLRCKLVFRVFFFCDIHSLEDESNQVVDLLYGLVDRVLLDVPHRRVLLVVDCDIGSLALRGYHSCFFL